MKVSVILPTYNEKDNVIDLINSICVAIKNSQHALEIIVIDDNSPDKTGKICREYFVSKQLVKVYIRTKERGLASAIFFGITKASGSIIIVMDTDFSHNPKLIPVMLTKIKFCDIVVGSRYANKGGGEDKVRYWMSKIYNMFLRYLLRIDISDFLFGYFCVKRDFLYKNGLVNTTIFSGFGDYFIKLAYYLNKSGSVFLEIPAFYKRRIYGSSKSNVVNMFFTYTKTALFLVNASRGKNDYEKK